LSDRSKTEKEAVMHYLIKDTDFLKIAQLLDKIKCIHTNNHVTLRIFLEEVFYVLKSSCQWRLLPLYYGNWRSVHKRFKAWSDRAIWKQLFEHLQDPDLEWVVAIQPL
jgi:transposase